MRMLCIRKVLDQGEGANNLGFILATRGQWPYWLCSSVTVPKGVVVHNSRRCMYPPELCQRNATPLRPINLGRSRVLVIQIESSRYLQFKRFQSSIFIHDQDLCHATESLMQISFRHFERNAKLLEPKKPCGPRRTLTLSSPTQASFYSNCR